MSFRFIASHSGFCDVCSNCVMERGVDICLCFKLETSPFIPRWAITNVLSFSFLSVLPTLLTAAAQCGQHVRPEQRLASPLSPEQAEPGMRVSRVVCP